MAKNGCHHLDLSERRQIYALLRQGLSLRAIATPVDHTAVDARLGEAARAEWNVRTTPKSSKNNGYSTSGVG